MSILFRCTQFTLALMLSASVTVALADNLYMTPSELVSVVREAKVINAAFPLRAIIDHDKVLIHTRKTPKATEKDLKIDTALVAKSLSDAFPTIHEVELIYSTEDSDEYITLSVPVEQLKAYGAGQLSEQQFLDAMKLAKSSNESMEPESDRGNSGGAILPGPARKDAWCCWSVFSPWKSTARMYSRFWNAFKRLTGWCMMATPAGSFIVPSIH